MPHIPTATYRCQFNHQFTFKQAIELIDYFDELGITDIYASPITKARARSLHGYDVVDHNQIDPEIGTEEEFARLSQLLQQKGMGLILDIVPNHMCIADAGNKWWDDVLENGPNSIYADYFDILWDHPKVELKNKVVLPILAEPFGQAIDNQDFSICYREGEFYLKYKSFQLPLNPQSWHIIFESEATPEDLLNLSKTLEKLSGISDRNERHHEKENIKNLLKQLIEKSPAMQDFIQARLHNINGVKGNPHSFDQLEQLLKEQSYRLSFWRLTNDLINYRRFFDVNELACLHVEKSDVFEAVHQLVFRCIKNEWVTGLRVDHVDGLYDPKKYLEQLQEKCGQKFYIVVEKILIGQEKLHADWPVFGTTGYDFLNSINGIFVVHDHAYQMQQLYDFFIGSHQKLSEIVFKCKKLILSLFMSNELRVLVNHLEEISKQHRWTYDFSTENLQAALGDLIACFPVYRSYIRPEDKDVSREDQIILLKAIDGIRKISEGSQQLIIDYLQSVLMLQDEQGLNVEQIQARRKFVLQFQQLTGPVMAKGFEDTALYQAYPLASLNDVGMDAESFGYTVEEFHEQNQFRLLNWPHTLLATFTHDTKRSEDVRARINVLSENPLGWKEALYRWKALNKSKKKFLENFEVPDANEEYLFYQTLIGTWPGLKKDEVYVKRIQEYMLKAIKEAKIHTSWIKPDEQYEKDMLDFVKDVLEDSQNSEFLIDFDQFVQPIIKAGRYNSLSQLLLKMTVPGVPDFFQGSELWELTLVDPDNRRPVDFSKRKQMLQLIKEQAENNLDEILCSLEDGKLKMYLMWRVLNFRKQFKKLFEEGEYLPLQVMGDKKKNVMAFIRKHGQDHCIVATGRFFTQLPDTLGKAWGNTEIYLDSKGRYKDILTGQEFNIENQLPASEIFSKLPFAILAFQKE